MGDCILAATPWASGTVLNQFANNCENLDTKTIKVLLKL